MNIIGDLITLRAIEISDLDMMQKWANDPSIQYMLGGWHFPTNRNDQEKWYENLSCNSMHQRFLVVDKDSTKVGMANLVNINFKDGNAELGVLLDPKFQGKGFGKDIVETLMKYSFEELRLNRLETSIIASNKPSLGLFLNKCNWTQEGILRNWYFRNGQFIDKMMLSILSDEYKELKK